jgi:hypothetical protein
MNIRKLLPLVMLAAALSPMASRASGPVVHTVEIRSFEFVPYAIAAHPGDIINFVAMAGARCPGRGCADHSVVSYVGTPSFDARSANNTKSTTDANGNRVCSAYPCGGDPAGMVPYEVFSIQYQGGLVRFRDDMNHDASTDQHPNPAVPNSSLDANGQCTGECGYITDAPPANLPGVPVITTPAAGAKVASTTVTIAGTSSNAARVLLRQHLTGSAIRELTSVYPAADGSWSWPWNFGANGPYAIDAIAIHTDGYRSDPSPVTNFTIAGADLLPPWIRLDKPAAPTIANIPPIQTGRLDITGRVFDDVAVANVIVTVHTNLPPSLGGTNVDLTPHVEFKVGATDTTFSASVTPGTGWYTVTVTAVDAAQRTDTSVKPDGSHAAPTTRDVIMAI